MIKCMGSNPVSVTYLFLHCSKCKIGEIIVPSPQHYFKHYVNHSEQCHRVLSVSRSGFTLKLLKLKHKGCLICTAVFPQNNLSNTFIHNCVLKSNPPLIVKLGFSLACCYYWCCCCSKKIKYLPQGP